MSLPSDFPCRNVIAVADLHTHVDLKKIVERTYIAEFEREPKVRVCMCDTIVAHACTYMHICRNLRFHSSCCSCISSLPLQTCIYRVCVCVCVCVCFVMLVATRLTLKRHPTAHVLSQILLLRGKKINKTRAAVELSHLRTC